MKIRVTIFVTVILLTATLPVYGNGGEVLDPTLIRKVPELKKACEAASKTRWETGTTAQMLGASYDYQDCLIGIIEKILEAYYPADHRDFIKRVRDIAGDIRVLYWDIYCLREELCGSMFNVASTGNQSGFIENVLKIMVIHIELETQ